MSMQAGSYASSLPPKRQIFIWWFTQGLCSLECRQPRSFSAVSQWSPGCTLPRFPPVEAEITQVRSHSVAVVKQRQSVQAGASAWFTLPSEQRCCLCRASRAAWWSSPPQWPTEGCSLWALTTGQQVRVKMMVSQQQYLFIPAS